MDDLTRAALAAQRGDRQALDRFVRLSQADVWRLCAHLGDRSTADDLTQETYLRAVRALPRFRAASGARSWLLAIARHTCADHVRRRTRERRLGRRLEDHAVAGVIPDTAPGTAELDDLVASLHPDRREAFVLTQLLGLSYDEAAEMVGCPVGTIRSRVSRARADLLDRIDDRAEQPADRAAHDAGGPSASVRRLG